MSCSFIYLLRSNNKLVPGIKGKYNRSIYGVAGEMLEIPFRVKAWIMDESTLLEYKT